MKKLIYLLFILSLTHTTTHVHAQSKKVGTYTFKNGDVYTGELAGNFVLGY